MSRTPQSKPPQRMASMAWAFCAGNVLAGKLMDSYTEVCNKFRGQVKHGAPGYFAASCRQLLRVNILTRRGKKASPISKGLSRRAALC
jgi:hypothetical protein